MPRTPTHASLERDILRDGTVTHAEIRNAIESIGTSPKPQAVPKSVQRDIQKFTRRVAKLESSLDDRSAPTAKQLRPLRILARTLTWKLADIAWTLAKGHMFIGTVGAYGYHTKKEWKGKMALVCASWMLFTQWDLARKSAQNWLKHKVQLTLWQVMIRLLALPIDVPIFLIKKINAGVRSYAKKK
jgi:hypothetical protein